MLPLVLASTAEKQRTISNIGKNLVFKVMATSFSSTTGVLTRFKDDKEYEM